MNTSPFTQQSNTKSDVTAGVLKRLIEVGVAILIQAAILFISAGRLDWDVAWAYLVVYVGVVAINSLMILPKNPELIAERGQPKKNAKNWDKVLSSLTGVASLITLVVAGLGIRFGQPPQVALTIQFVALASLVLGYGLFSWAMASNPFFSTLVRIQDDRGHAVASTGPYRYVRHPGYVGWIILSLATPLMLGSLWGLIPGGLSALLMAVRTALEDRTLQNELDGYKDYAQQVRYRLFPGVW
jgi:protein-S-isoprenylcysteine O-methyltransferase Ste14